MVFYKGVTAIFDKEGLAKGYKKTPSKNEKVLEKIFWGSDRKNEKSRSKSFIFENSIFKKSSGENKNVDQKFVVIVKNERPLKSLLKSPQRSKKWHCYLKNPHLDHKKSTT